MAVKTGGRKLSEAELNAPDLDDDGNLDVEHYVLPDGGGIDNPYLRALWDEAVRTLPETQESEHKDLAAADGTREVDLGTPPVDPDTIPEPIPPHGGDTMLADAVDEFRRRGLALAGELREKLTAPKPAPTVTQMAEEQATRRREMAAFLEGQLP